MAALALEIAVGTAAALALSQSMAGLLFGVTARDPLIFVAIPMILTLVGFVAVLVPALRATRVDPVNALRAE